MTRLIMIRHGFSMANATHRFAGHSNFPLSDIGYIWIYFYNKKTSPSLCCRPTAMFKPMPFKETKTYKITAFPRYHSSSFRNRNALQMPTHLNSITGVPVCPY